MVKTGNGQICWQIYPPVVTFSGPEWQFHISTDIQWSRMAIGRSTPRFAGRSTPRVPTCSGQDWQMADLPADLHPPVLTSNGPELQFHVATDI